MPRPNDLIDTAKMPASARAGFPTDADLRRCISTAYHAVFHAVLTAGTDRFFGAAHKGRGVPACFVVPLTTGA